MGEWLDEQDWLFAPIDVAEWPRWGRRLFLLLLPVSGPLWVGYLILLILSGLALMGLAALFNFIRGVGHGIATLWGQP